jgi:hypothetical protein
MLNIALIGVFFALCYLKSGSLWWPIGFHAAWNFFLGCVWSLPVSGINVYRVLDVQATSNATLTGGVFGAEGSLLLTPLILVLIWAISQLPDHPQAHSDLQVLKSPPVPMAEVVAPAEKVEEEPLRPSRFRTSMRPQQVGPVVDPHEAGIAPPPVEKAVTQWTPAPRQHSAEQLATAPADNSAFQVDVTQTAAEAKTETPTIQEIKLPEIVTTSPDLSTQPIPTIGTEIPKTPVETPQPAPRTPQQVEIPSEAPTTPPPAPAPSATTPKKPRPKW